ncbi:MAG TPA: PqqD family protein [Ignavibacteriales bacterium]|nr:PqqD family protein [Ignavibacteriales bacterium]
MFKKKKINSSINYLELTPKRVYNYEVESSGKISVLVPKFKNKLLVNFLAPRLKAPYIKAKLDDFGSLTWIEMDGTKNVESISQLLTDKFGDKVQPANERLTKFLTQLYQYNFITFNEINSKGDLYGRNIRSS